MSADRRAAHGAFEVEAPAKINLFLHVLHRRPDGFHELETLFQSISLADRVVVAVGAPGTDAIGASGGPVALTVTGADLGPVEDNLAYRAAERFREAAGLDAPIHVELEKRIPAGAGLGGGSSDAAAVLRCLAGLTGFDHHEALHDMAADLGSDVPFFLAGSPLALGQGRGEVLTELPPLPEASLVLALPDVHVATGEAYAELAARREAGQSPRSSRVDQGDIRREVGSWDDVVNMATNDFEAVVVPEHEEVRQSLEGLHGRGARTPLVSGSGAACFGLFPDHETARAAAAWLEGRYPWRFMAVETRTEVPVPRPI